MNLLFKMALDKYEGQYVGVALPAWVTINSVENIYKDEVMELAIDTGLNEEAFRKIFF